MITNIITELKNEQAAGNQLAMEFAERLDAHIRDFENLKAWVFNNLAARSEAIDLMLGEKATEAPAPDDEVEIAFGPNGWVSSSEGPVIESAERQP